MTARGITSGPLSLVLALSLAQVAIAGNYQVDLNAKNLVTFISDAPIEDIEGVTSAIDGYVSWSGDSLTSGADYDSSEVYFEVELDGLKTGIGLRDRHLRNNYLETDLYPYAFIAGRILGVEIAGDTSRVEISGTFTIHGVERPFGTICTVVRTGPTYHVMSEFEVRLTEHNIEVPSLMFLKVNEVISVKLNFYLRPMDPAE